MLDLPKHGGNPSAIMRSTIGQIRGDDLTRARVDREVQFPPGPVFRRLPPIADVNPEARAVDEQVDRSMARDRTKRDLTERLESPGQSRMVGNRNLHLEPLGQGTQEALGLSERKVKDHADRESCLDRDVRVGALTTGFATRRSSPGVDGVIGKPDGKVASSL